MKSRSREILVGMIVLLSANTGFALNVQWAPIASRPNYLLEEENLDNPGGIEHSWNDVRLHDPGQRSLATFRGEMSSQRRYGGGINWDDLPEGTDIANGSGIDLNILGLPFDVKISATTNGNPMTVLYKEQPQPRPENAGSVSGTKFIDHFDNINPRDLVLQFQPSEDYYLQGFGIIFANSGWSLGGATITFYNSDTPLAQFGINDGVRFLDHSTDDNFIGYWANSPITKVHIMADDMVALGRFDDIGLVFVPEPATVLLLGLGVVMVIRKR